MLSEFKEATKAIEGSLRNREKVTDQSDSATPFMKRYVPDKYGDHECIKQKDN